LAMGLDAIFAHWGGSHYALDKLDLGFMDNIDAMVNPFDAFYRKQTIPMPHNGFTSGSRLEKAAKNLDYRLENKFEGYLHLEKIPETKNLKSKSLFLNYPDPYNVYYQYRPDFNDYLRFRDKKPEIDKNNNQQIAVKVVVIMRASSRQIEGPYYNDVDVEGSGICEVYQNGEKENCVWQKDKSRPDSKLYFLDSKNKEIKFTPGQIWVEIVEPEQKIEWK